MTILIDLLMVTAGLGLLVFAGDALVRGASSMAVRAGIPPMVVGLTVVAFGTSAPELLVSVEAVLKDASGIALGNVVGSNIANVLLVLGVPALISVIHAGDGDARRGYLTMIAASLLFIALCFIGPLVWWHGLILLAGLGLMLADNLRSARRHKAGAEPELEGADPHAPVRKIAALIGVGLVGLSLGANLLVDGAVDIARLFGVSELIIGLTLVAVGTSLPELATTVAAAFRRNADVALGNVVGSNIFNLLGIIGVAALVGPLPVPPDLLRVDLWIMLAAAVVLGPVALRGASLGRGAGLALLGAYGAYIVLLVMRG